MPTDLTINSISIEKKSRQQQLIDQFTQLYWQNIKGWISAAGDAGISEYKILKKINTMHEADCNFIDFSSPQSLFPIHFILFHRLYQWRDRLSHLKSDTLLISALCIRLTSNGNSTQISDHDSTRDYYLNIENLTNTSDTILNKMLDNFWLNQNIQDELATAFSTLGIKPTANRREIKRSYQKHMTIHHPDKGGCENKAKELNQAMFIIQKALNGQGLNCEHK